jgi:hypothetical protein
MIYANKAGATGIDADWNIIRGQIQNIGSVALVDGANIATDCEKGNVFTVTLAGNRTLDNPTNKIVGQQYTWVITQDATGDRAISYGTDFVFRSSGDIDPTPASNTIIIGVVTSTGAIQCEKFGNQRTTYSRWRVENGYGSSSTAIKKYTTEVVASNQKVVDVSNSSSLGMTITAKIPCTVNISIAADIQSGGYGGVTLNSAQLTTSIQGLTDDSEIITMTYQTTANRVAPFSCSIELEKGDILRHHGDKGPAGSQPNLSVINILAIEKL